MYLQIILTLLILTFYTFTIAQPVTLTLRQYFDIDGTEEQQKNKAILHYAESITEEVHLILDQNQSMGYYYCSHIKNGKCDRTVDWNIYGYLDFTEYGWRVNLAATKDADRDKVHEIPGILRIIFQDDGLSLTASKKEKIRGEIEEWLIPNVKLKTYFNSIKMYLSKYQRNPNNPEHLSEIYNLLSGLAAYFNSDALKKQIREDYREQISETSDSILEILKTRSQEIWNAYSSYLKTEFDIDTDGHNEKRIDLLEKFYEANKNIYKVSNRSEKHKIDAIDAVDNMLFACEDLLILYKTINDKVKKAETEGRLDILNILRP